MAVVKFSGLNPEELAKLEVALKDEAFVDSLAEKKDAAEVQKALEARGINFTVEEVEKIRETLIKASKESAELSEESLEDVAGGGTFTLVSISWKTKRGTQITVNIPW